MRRLCGGVNYKITDPLILPLNKNDEMLWNFLYIQTIYVSINNTVEMLTVVITFNIKTLKYTRRNTKDRGST